MGGSWSPQFPLHDRVFSYAHGVCVLSSLDTKLPWFFKSRRQWALSTHTTHFQGHKCPSQQATGRRPQKMHTKGQN